MNIKKILFIGTLALLPVWSQAQEDDVCFSLTVELEIVDGDWEGQVKENNYTFSSEADCNKKLSEVQSSDSEGWWWGRWAYKSSSGCSPCGGRSSDDDPDWYGNSSSSSGNSNVSGSTGTTSSGTGPAPGADQVIYDEYDPSIKYEYNEETGMYEQLEASPEEAAEEAERRALEEQAEAALAEQERIAREAYEREVVEAGTERVFDAADRFGDRLKELKKERAAVRDEELPIIGETSTGDMDFEAEDLNTSELDQHISEFSDLMKATSTISTVTGNESLGKFSGTGKEIIRHAKTGSHLYEAIQDPNNLGVRAELYEDAIGYTTKAAGTAGVAYGKFSPPVNLWERTYSAVLDRAGSALSGTPSLEIDVWAPTLDYMGKASGSGNIGNIMSDYRHEKEMSWNQLRKKHGFIQATKRKVLFNLFDDFYP